MSEHPALRSSVDSRSSALPPPYQRLPPQHADPLNSVWIRRLHPIPDHPPPPPRPPPPPPPPLLQAAQPQDAVSTDESRTPPPPHPAAPLSAPGFGPFRWSPRPLRAAPPGAWDAVSATSSPVRSVSGGGGPPMLSPFFRLPAPPLPQPVTDVGEFSNTVPLIEVSSSGGSGSGSGSAAFPGLSSRMTTPGGSSHVARFAMGVAGSAYPTHPVDMVPVRTLQDIHDRQPSVIPRNFAMHSPSSGSQHDGFSYWNMGRFRRNTTAPSFPPSGVAPGNFGKKRNADSNNFLPLKFRKMSGAI
ncbi:WAS/WASL-interacting protein family member 3-like [Oryza brachyantha]|uniref:WAS/WASL-interacting protein family member 3-like n=1 Tax=Oryza brachyantha TaxID=4533 RepID=UPI001ADAD5AF|nr:WAS/WASL-interacting protein family member 3-like [Oryza brachyantha]